jgi:hypothetical protein
VFTKTGSGQTKETLKKQRMRFLQGTLSSVPAGHVHKTLVVAGDGVRGATGRWGNLLMQVRKQE